MKASARSRSSFGCRRCVLPRVSAKAGNCHGLIAIFVDSQNWELFADTDPRSLEDWDTWADDASHDGTLPTNTPPKFLTTMDEAQQNCLLADIYIWNARLKRLSDDVTQAKASLQEAWQAMYRTSDLSGSGYDDDIQFWANAIEKYVVPPESAKAFRHLPVAKGFRLMTGSGWAASLATARESTILSEVRFCCFVHRLANKTRHVLIVAFCLCTIFFWGSHAERRARGSGAFAIRR